MNLLEYIKPMKAGEVEAFASKCCSTPGQIRQVAYGRRASAELAIRIDKASCGAVRCEDIRPDIDWSYLRNPVESAAA
tara:strand:+ start:1143 stop:1376 length:234 start_codon:yes stop_codon:yes gene_type:complete